MSSQDDLIVHVVDHRHQPVAGARVIRTSTDGEDQESVTGSDGRARFDVSASAAAELKVSAANFGEDSRVIGGDLPVSGDGYELFILGPAEWPRYFRGRVRVPFEPVVDAVGVMQPTPIHAEESEYVADLIGQPVRGEVTFSDDNVAIVQLTDLHLDTDHEGITRDARPSRVQALDFTVEAINDRTPDETLVGAIVSMNEQGASFLSDAVVVSLLSDDIDIDGLARQHGFVVETTLRALGRTYRLRSAGDAGYGLLDRIEALAAVPGVRYAEPDLVSTVIYDAVTPNDFLFGQQWDHQIINTPDAWQVLRDLNASRTFGDPAVTIAVVDNGIDVNHPSLAGNVSNGQTKVAQVFDFANMTANNNTLSINSPDHGMACATGAAGLADTGVGTTGVAGNCRVIGVRSGGMETRYAQMYMWLAGLDADSDTEGFPAQLAQGADVITSSFGTGVVTVSQTMRDAFDAVTDQGRGGRGTAMFFSAGNGVDVGGVIVPQRLDTNNVRPWATYSRCYGVTASSLDVNGVDEVRTWYSNFGSQINFCAPTNTATGAHNPTNSYGAFTATRLDSRGGEGVAGRAVNSTTMSAASVANATQIEVASVAGATVGGSCLMGPRGNVGSRGRTITGVDATNRRITFATALPAGFANGTAVVFAPHEYRSDFGGTSYATPVTAGVAALMYSVNPQLTWRQVGQILGHTATRIDRNNTDPDGRWRDVNGQISTSPAYAGPHFSEFYGRGRINAGAAVARAAWTIDLVTNPIRFNDVPEGEETYRSVRFNVRSLYRSDFSTVTPPGAPFSMPIGTTDDIAANGDYSKTEEAYIWISYTGEAAGTTTTDSITVRHDQTGREWTIPIEANSIEPVTAGIELVLDRSGSMASASGVGTEDRNDVLRYSAGILVEALHEGDGVGVVGFDQDASVVMAPVGPLAEPGSLFDPHRNSARTSVAAFGVTTGGTTSIGDGIDVGSAELGTMTGYDSTSLVVFTDGYENAHQFISDVSGLITERTFAVALGRAEHIKPAALTEVTNGSGGYCVLTGDLDDDSRYKLAKYFLQILAGVKNDEVVVDPEVVVEIEDTVDVPFYITEADTVIDVLFLTRYPFLVQMTLIAPDGDEIDPSFMAGLSGRNYTKVGDDIVYYRMTLPAPIGSGARAGQWLARYYFPKAQLAATHKHGRRLTTADLNSLSEHGLRGTMLVHASSHLKMAVEVEQKSLEPGSDVLLRAQLTEYDIPVRGRAAVHAAITEPSGAQYGIDLYEVEPGVFETSMHVGTQGVWTVLFRAKGEALRGSPFTREQVRTISVWDGGDSYEPKEGEEPGIRRPQKTYELIFRELLRDPVLARPIRARLVRAGIDVESLLTEDA